MPEIDPVILQIKADMDRYRAELRSSTTLVANSLGQQEQAVRRLERQMERSLGSIEARGKIFADRFGGYLAGFATGALINELAKLADQSKQLDAQLRLATASFGSLARAQEDTRRIAASTRNSLEATTKLYAGFIRASQETGRTQDDAARATQTFAEALKIGGAGAAEAASATLQFNQALQSGVLRGDEFNSIMEASPRIARLLADALKVPIGRLRSMAEAGKITADVLFKALTNTRFTAGIDAEFKQLPQTFGEAMQSISNTAVVTFGAFDKGGQFSNAVIHLLSDGTDTFAGLEKLATDYGVETRAVFDALGNVFDPLLSGAQTVFGGIRTEVNYTRDSIANIIRGYDRLNNLFIDLGNRATSFDNAVKRGLNHAIDRAGGGQHFVENPLTPRSDYAGKFLRGYDDSVRQSRARLASDAQAAARAATAAVRKPPTAAPSKPKKDAAAERAAAKAAKDRAEAAEERRIWDLQRGMEEGHLLGDQYSDYGRTPLVDFSPNMSELGDIADAGQRSFDGFMDRQRDQIDTLAGYYQRAFEGGTDGIMDTFKHLGLQVISELLAKWTVQNVLGGGGVGGLLGGGGGGLLGKATGFLGGLFGRAYGGYVSGGSLVRVNEGASPGRVEGFRPTGSGMIVPLGQMDAARPNGGVTVIAHQSFDLRGSLTTPKLMAEMDARSRAHAAQAGQAAYQQAVGAAPAAVRYRSRSGS